MRDRLYDAVLHALLEEISVQFLERRKDAIGLVTLEDVSAHAQRSAPVSEGAQEEPTRRRMLVLVRYLVMAHGDVFGLEAGALALRATVTRDRSAVRWVVQSFGSRVHRQLARITGRVDDNSGECPYSLPMSPPSGESADGGAPPLEDFFRGFEEEIARMRLGGAADFR
ncbi:hypothetical protein RB614_24285 [Phytohabitans sp. ZYX-F-186]|uniref:Uncharacterized protein n=1 Tax=Phytohabitans maris TaxID=3071409 RepID=A0ABU0ZKU4_9ACTN|nr:hypothetical protein [Phytohabitans sp. ZYX-F-186]MDQ7907645.1 hypothetical protein [Phytohabitans sp. ZYX-F-186]